MYFYMFAGQLYWGRYQGIASDPGVLKAWYFRNKPAKVGRFYISGPYIFRFKISEQFGLYEVEISYKGEKENGYLLRPGVMYYLRDGSIPQNIDRHEEARALTARTFRNRLREYKGRYFLPFHKFSRCV